MDAITITTAQIHRYLDQLSMEEKSFATLKKYRHDLLFFLSFTAKHAVDKALILKYKEQLQGKYAVTSANSIRPYSTINAALHNGCCAASLLHTLLPA